MLIVNLSLATFWRYCKGNNNASLNELEASDIQNFLDSLETALQLKKSTINKYLSHIRLYFAFLYSHHLIDHYPMLEISGRKFSRKHVYLIDWMDYLPQIAAIPQIHPETIMMLVGIAKGFYPDEVLKLRYSDIIGSVTNPDLKRYIKEHLNFSQNSDPYILGKEFGGTYPADFHLVQRLIADRKKLGMEITLQSLRLSFVYSILNRKNMTDQELEKILRINGKTLAYYRENMLRYNSFKKFTLKK